MLKPSRRIWSILALKIALFYIEIEDSGKNTPNLLKQKNLGFNRVIFLYLTKKLRCNESL